MSTAITASMPFLNGDTLNFELHAKFTNGLTKTAVLNIEFTELHPWSKIASTEAVDFFLLSSIVYGSDRFIPRRANSVDGWSREILLEIPVYNKTKWTKSKQAVEDLLSFLTGDYWTISFTKNTFTIPDSPLSPELIRSYEQVNLFSGGLDSLIGAIDTLEDFTKPSIFVSHYDPFMKGPLKDQTDLSNNLSEKYPSKFIHLPSIKIFLSDSKPFNETTSRSRSILFIGLALLIADANKINIIVPENGSVSVNFPLSSSRRSACSTRTTHPTFIGLLESIFTELGITTTITNHYKFQTKGEMVNGCRNKRLLSALIELSNSCGKRGHRAHWTNKGSHCGICLPCMYRQASLLKVSDGTKYGNSISEFESFRKKKEQDTGALLEFLKTTLSDQAIKIELIANGLKDLANLYKYIALVKETRAELSNWVKKNGNTFARTKAGL